MSNPSGMQRKKYAPVPLPSIRPASFRAPDVPSFLRWINRPSYDTRPEPVRVRPTMTNEEPDDSDEAIRTKIMRSIMMSKKPPPAGRHTVEPFRSEVLRRYLDYQAFNFITHGHQERIVHVRARTLNRNVETVVILSADNAANIEDVRPGEHGCIYTTSGFHLQLESDQEFQLFVRISEGRLGEMMRYMGAYIAWETEYDLSLSGWDKLPSSVRARMIDLHAGEVATQQGREEIRLAYERGKLRLPLIFLQNRSYDRNVAKSLVQGEIHAGKGSFDEWLRSNHSIW